MKNLKFDIGEEVWVKNNTGIIFSAKYTGEIGDSCTIYLMGKEWQVPKDRIFKQTKKNTKATKVRTFVHEYISTASEVDDFIKIKSNEMENFKILSICTKGNDFVIFYSYNAIEKTWIESRNQQ